MAEINFPDPSESPWEDPNGKMWSHDGDGWVCVGESTSEDSVRVTVYDAAGSYTHNFHTNAIRAEVWCIGATTGIKTFDISSASASITVGASSTYSDGTNTVGIDDGEQEISTTGSSDSVYIKEFLVVKPAPTGNLSRAPKTTVYDTAGGPYTHNFDPSARWVKVIVTGGGSGGSNAVSAGNSGWAGATAIKTYDITSASASLTVGAGGAVAEFPPQAEDSTYSDGAVSIVAGGGLQPTTATTTFAEATGGDINIKGGAGQSITTVTVRAHGGASYWGGGGHSHSTEEPAYGAGGGAMGNNTNASVGAAGVVVIEEHF